MTRSKSSKRWLQEHFQDQFVKKAQAEGYRSRAVYKLLEIQEKDRLIKPGMTVVDLGAAPGGWSQVAAQIVGGKGKVIASDILEMEPIDGVEFIQGDFREQAVYDALLNSLGSADADVVFSDMAPNMSGTKAIDQPASMYLADLAFDLAIKVLRHEGSFLIKLFHGTEFDQYLQQLKQHFKKVITRKPKASRPRSNEVYALAVGYKKV